MIFGSGLTLLISRLNLFQKLEKTEHSLKKKKSLLIGMSNAKDVCTQHSHKPKVCVLGRKLLRKSHWIPDKEEQGPEEQVQVMWQRRRNSPVSQGSSKVRRREPSPPGVLLE